MARLGAARRGRAPVGPVLLLVQPRPLRVAARVRIRPRSAVAVPGGPAAARSLLDGAYRDERRLPVPEAAPVRLQRAAVRLAVLRPGRLRDVDPVHVAGAALRIAGAMAREPIVVAAPRRRARSDPD